MAGTRWVAPGTGHSIGGLVARAWFAGFLEVNVPTGVEDSLPTDLELTGLPLMADDVERIRKATIGFPKY